jgi:opacity protein-like surface antigen
MKRAQCGVVLACTCAVLLAAAAAHGQEAAGPEAPQRRISGGIMAGVALPIGEARDAMGLGWNVGAAGALGITRSVALRLDYLYSRFAARSARWNVTLGPMLPAFQEVTVEAKSQMHAVSADVVVSRPLAGGRRVSVMAGPTFFRRRVQIRGDAAHGETSACEPLWLQCQAQGVPYDRALGIKKEDDLGFNVGAGLSFPIGLAAELTVEARYFHLRGPAFRAADGGTTRSSARFLPVSVGLTF